MRRLATEHYHAAHAASIPTETFAQLFLPRLARVGVRGHSAFAKLHVSGDEGWNVKVTESAGRRRCADGPVDDWMYRRPRASTDPCADIYACTDLHSYSNGYTCANLNTCVDRYANTYLNTCANRYANTYLRTYTGPYAYIDTCNCADSGPCIDTCPVSCSPDP